MKQGNSLFKKAGEALFGKAAVPEGERSSVRGHWSRVVKHNGWLLKKGGTTKSWVGFDLRLLLLPQCLAPPTAPAA